MSLKMECAQLIQKKISNKMTKDEFYLAILDLHAKYPMSGHEPPLTSYHFKNYKRIPEIKEYLDAKYETFIQPKNFKEAAEMFAQFENKNGPIQSWNDDTTSNKEE